MRKDKFVKLTIALFLTISSAMFIPPVAEPAHAAEVNVDDIVEVKIDEDGNWIKEGGLNRYAGEIIDSTEQGHEMETRLRADNYIEINDLTAEQYEAFVASQEVNWWFEEYIRPEEDKYSEYYNGWHKIYVFKPSFMDWWEEYQELGKASVTGVPTMEINSSSVVINYRVFWAREREGKDLSEEMNDGIPSWHDVGYISITSPIDAEIKLFLKDERNYYTIYLRADVPLRAKLKSGNYSIVEINGKEIGTSDKNITNGNTIDIGWEEEPSLEEPVEISVEGAVEAYGIEPIDLTGKPDRSIDKNQRLSSDEKVTVDEEEPESTEDVIQTDKPNWFKRILVAIIIIALCTVTGAFLYFDKKRRR